VYGIKNLLIGTRIGRSSIALACVMACYWLYATIAVPLIEPTVTRASGGIGDHQFTRKASPHAELLASYFSDDAWQRNRPKTLDTSSGTVLFQDYKTLPDGSMKLWPLTALCMLESSEEGKSRPVVLDVPEGAILKFDQPVALRTGVFSNPTGGQLLGAVAIYGAESEPNKGDKFFIKTHNVVISPERIETNEDVWFKYAGSTGKGRHLIMTMSPPESKQSLQSTEPPHRGVQSLELVHVESMLIDAPLDAPLDTLSNGAQPAQNVPPSATQNGPIKITCDGPLKIDMVRRVASFEQNVAALVTAGERQGDDLKCDRLLAHFAQASSDTQLESPLKKTTATADAAPSFVGLSRLEAIGISAAPGIVATPAVANSPSQKAFAQGHRLIYLPPTRTIHIIDDNLAILRHPRGNFTGLDIEYTAGLEGRLGELTAIGPGQFQGTFFDKNDSDENDENVSQDAKTIFCHWTERFETQRENGKLSLHLHGTPATATSARQAASVRISGEPTANASQGESQNINANSIHLYLLEQLVTNKTRTTESGTVDRNGQPPKPKFTYVPDRLAAVGNVRFNSTQVSGLVESLQAWFEQEPAPAGPVPQPLTSSPQTAPSEEVATPSPQAEPQEPLLPIERFDVQGQVLQMLLAWRGEEESPVLKNLQMLGDFKLTSSLGSVLQGPNLNIDRPLNTIKIDGPGLMSRPIDKDMDGKLLEVPQNFRVTWQDSMNFNGSPRDLPGALIHFRGSVMTNFESQPGTEQTSRMTESGTLDILMWKHIDLMNDQLSEKPNPKKITLTPMPGKSVHIEDRAWKDRLAQSISHLYVPSLVVDIFRDQNTDDRKAQFRADGPGELTAIRRKKPQKAKNSIGPITRPAPSSELEYTNIRYQGSLTGGHQPWGTKGEFINDVHVIHGPVNHWNDWINLDRVVSEGREFTALDTDKLTVLQFGKKQGNDAPFEVIAEGNTRVDGLKKSEKDDGLNRGKLFSAEGARITYDKQKDLMTLEGDGRNDARVTQRDYYGGLPKEFKAGKIRFWQETQIIRMENLRSVTGSDRQGARR